MTRLDEIEARRFLPCHTCEYVGDIGKDSRGMAIAWCHVKHHVVGADIGCDRYHRRSVGRSRHDQT